MKHRFKIWFQIVTMIFAVLSLAFATYAWFTTNREVSTSTATARTGEETLELQLSTSGGGSFRDADSVSIQQVNQTSAEYLLPVSTSNLVNFVYSPNTEAGIAKAFQPVENESYYSNIEEAELDLMETAANITDLEYFTTFTGNNSLSEPVEQNYNVYIMEV